MSSCFDKIVALELNFKKVTEAFVLFLTEHLLKLTRKHERNEKVILGMKNILGYISKKIAISNYITGFQKVNEAMKRKKSIVCVNHKDGQISF